MFGYTSSAAAVRNVFLVGNGSNTVAYVNAQGGNSASGSASRVSMGVLVGYNRGTVSNCSVSGYTMEYYGYSASTASLGGFVGSNYGTIRNSASDCPSIRFANTNSNTYAGGFAGVNHALFRIPTRLAAFRCAARETAPCGSRALRRTTPAA